MHQVMGLLERAGSDSHQLRPPALPTARENRGEQGRTVRTACGAWRAAPSAAAAPEDFDLSEAAPHRTSRRSVVEEIAARNARMTCSPVPLGP